MFFLGTKIPFSLFEVGASSNMKLKHYPYILIRVYNTFDVFYYILRNHLSKNYFLKSKKLAIGQIIDLFMLTFLGAIYRYHLILNVLVMKRQLSL